VSFSNGVNKTHTVSLSLNEALIFILRDCRRGEAQKKSGETGREDGDLSRERSGAKVRADYSPVSLTQLIYFTTR